MILSYINLGIGNLIPFLYTPIMLQLLGQSEYGLYKIAGSTTSYLSLMAFGIGSAVSRFIIRARTQEGKEAEERMFGLFNLLFRGIALLTLIVGGIVAWNLDFLYGASLTPDQLSRMKILVSLMAINTAVSFSATSYNAVVSSHERFLFIHSINIISTIGTPVCNLIILFMGYRSVGMAMVSLSLNILVRVIYILYVRRALEIKPRYDHLPGSALREIFAFSFWIFVSNIVSRIYSATDTVIIGAIPALATVGAAVYSVGTTFSSIMYSLAQVTPGLFAPRVNKMVFSGASSEKLSNLMIKAGRMQGYIVALVCSGFIAFGMAFLDCYVGPGYREAYWVAVVIMIPNCIPLVQSVANSVQQAKGMNRFRAKVYLLIALINVFGTIILVQEYGIIGAAIPTGAAYLLGHGLIMNWFYWKRVHLDIPRFWKNMIPVFMLAGVMCIAALVISNWIDFYRWDHLLAGILAYTVIYCLGLWKWILSIEEKNMISGVFLKNLKK